MCCSIQVSPMQFSCTMNVEEVYAYTVHVNASDEIELRDALIKREEDNTNNDDNEGISVKAKETKRIGDENNMEYDVALTLIAKYEQLNEVMCSIQLIFYNHNEREIKELSLTYRTNQSIIKSYTNIIKLEQLDYGMYGIVYKGQFNNKDIAIKEFLFDETS